MPHSLQRRLTLVRNAHNRKSVLQEKSITPTTATHISDSVTTIHLGVNKDRVYSIDYWSNIWFGPE